MVWCGESVRWTYDMWFWHGRCFGDGMSETQAFRIQRAWQRLCRIHSAWDWKMVVVIDAGSATISMERV